MIIAGGCQSQEKAMETRIQQNRGENSSDTSAAAPSRSASLSGILAENPVRIREVQLRRIIDTIPALAWTAHPNSSAEFPNQRWLDYAGLSSEETCNRGDGCGSRTT
jgi:hypothetical protein